MALVAVQLGAENLGAEPPPVQHHQREQFDEPRPQMAPGAVKADLGLLVAQDSHLEQRTRRP